MEENWSPFFAILDQLNFNSHHPTNNKIAIIYYLLDRAIKLSHNSFHKENTEFIKQVLQNNDYPHNLVDLQIKKRLKMLQLSDNNPKQPKNYDGIICLVFVN